MEYALIASMIAPLMKQPDRRSELEDEGLCGMSAEILENCGSWRRIRMEYLYEGWVHESCLCADARLVEEWASLPKNIVVQAYADVLDRPAVQGVLVGEVTRGARLSPLNETKDGWRKVRFCDGREGWIWEAFLGDYLSGWDASNEQQLRHAIAQTALGYLGVQYRWGGKTPLGIDCSGLCAMAYLLNGVVIYRDAHIVPDFPVHEIDLKDAKEGDLLFFPGHVALYLGGGRYAHSTAGNNCHGVVINSLDPEAPDYRADLPAKLTAVGSIF